VEQEAELSAAVLTDGDGMSRSTTSSVAEEIAETKNLKQNKMNKKLIIGLLVVLALAGLAWFFFLRKKDEAAPATTPETPDPTAGRGGAAVVAKPVAVGSIKIPVGVRPGAVKAGEGRGDAVQATQGRG
jgi:hypothetical protein